MDTLEACHAFDSTNLAASTPHREATRHVSGSQEGAGAALARSPDDTVRQSVIAPETPSGNSLNIMSVVHELTLRAFRSTFIPFLIHATV